MFSVFQKHVLWEFFFANFRLRLMSAPGNRRLLLNPQASWEEVKGHLKDGEMEAREQVVEYNEKKTLEGNLPESRLTGSRRVKGCWRRKLP